MMWMRAASGGLGVASVASLALLAGCARGDDEAPGETAPEAEATKAPVAIVYGEPIPRSAFERIYNQTLDRYRRAKHDVKPALRERLKDNVVRRLVDQALIEHRAEHMEVTLDPATVEAKWAEHKKRYGSDEAFAAFLERAGTTAEDVRANFEANLLREAVFARIAADVAVSAEEIRTFYEENQERYAQPERVAARHILIRVPPGAAPEVVAKKKKLAQKVRRKARREGADFAQLAAQYGEDPTRDRGGRLRPFAKGTMAKPFEEAAWALEVGEVSRVVRTKFGFHVIEKTGHQPASKKTLEEVSERIERGLLARKRNQAIREALERWKEDADIDILLKGDPEIINAAYDRSKNEEIPSALRALTEKGRPETKTERPNGQGEPSGASGQGEPSGSSSQGEPSGASETSSPPR
jgi:peptidyl-prolyl cis-trans isomerase C